jgi:hypothetical protein
VSSRINTIPTPTNDPESMLAAIRALKDVVERLTGQRLGTEAAGRAPSTYVQAIAPDSRAGTPLLVGDFWVSTGTDRLHYWTGQYWRPIQS